jgi:hypothetical protein
MTDRNPSPKTSSSGRQTMVHPRARYRGAFRIGLAISALVHLVAVALYPSFFAGLPEPSFRLSGSARPEAPQGTELVNLRELPADQDPDAPAPPEDEPDVQEPEVPRTTTPAGILDRPGLEAELPGPPGPTAAERLRPRAEDLRFWAPVDPERTAPTPEEIMRLRFVALLETLNDSAAAAAAAAAEATDWTYTDADGKKWGISPGKLHLGDLTLPLPSFGTSAGQRERAEDRLWAWDAIERGAAAGAVRQSWRDRDREIRERMNAERKPDTTRTGGGG